MKLWQGVVLGVVYLAVGYPIARELSIPGDVRSVLFVSVLTLALAAVLLAVSPPAGRRAAFRVRRPLLGWCLAMVVGLRLMAELSTLLAYTFAYNGASTERMQGSMPLLMLAVIVLGPLDEELIFRGGIAQGLCARISWKAGIAVSAVLFMGAHSWVQWPQTLFTGLLLGYLCWYTGSIGYGILIHIAYNGSCFVPISGYSLLMQNAAAGTGVLLLAVAGGLALALWGLRGFTRTADRLAAEAQGPA